MARPPSDSPPDSSSPRDAADDVHEVKPSEKPAPPSDPPPSSKTRPPLPERINTIDIMQGTLIGAHLPKLLEEEAANRAAQASPAPEIAPAQVAPDATRTKQPDSADGAASDDSHEPWRSPLETRPAWLIALASVPMRVWAMAGGGLVAGLLLVTAARGCVGKSRIDDLERRVATLEKTAGVNPDAGTNAVSEPAASNANAAATSGASPANPVTPTTDDPKKKDCAVAKLAAYQAWQGAADKAKTLAAPAEAKCSGFWTDAKKQACYGAATQSIRGAESARDATIKGGGTARDAVKKVKDDPKNDAIARARAASSTAFDVCQDDNEL